MSISSKNLFNIHLYSQDNIKWATRNLIEIIFEYNFHYKKKFSKIIKIGGNTKTIKRMLDFGMATKNQSLLQFSRFIGRYLFVRLVAAMNMLSNFNYQHLNPIMIFNYHYRRQLKHPASQPAMLNLNDDGLSEGFYRAGFRGYYLDNATYNYLANHPTGNPFKNVKHLSLISGKITSHNFNNYLDLLRLLSPKCFVFSAYSNQKGLHLIEQLIKLTPHYNTNYYLFNSAKFQIAQIGIYLVIIGIQKSLSISSKKLIHHLRKQQTNHRTFIKKVLIPIKPQQSQQPLPKSVMWSNDFHNTYITSLNYPYFPKVITNCKYHSLSISVAKTLASLKPGVTFLAHNHQDTGFDIYYRPILNQPYPSLKLLSAISVCPQQNRLFSTRELARIQSYPDSYLFLSNYTYNKYQITHSFPPFLALQLGNELKSVLK